MRFDLVVTPDGLSVAHVVLRRGGEEVLPRRGGADRSLKLRRQIRGLRHLETFRKPMGDLAVSLLGIIRSSGLGELWLARNQGIHQVIWIELIQTDWLKLAKSKSFIICINLNLFLCFYRFFALLMFGSYSVCNIIVLLNMLIAMMSNSYTIISEKSDMEWKFARSEYITCYHGHKWPSLNM